MGGAQPIVRDIDDRMTFESRSGNGRVRANTQSKKEKKMNHADLSREGEKKWERGGKIRKEGA